MKKLLLMIMFVVSLSSCSKDPNEWIITTEWDYNDPQNLIKNDTIISVRVFEGSEDDVKENVKTIEGLIKSQNKVAGDNGYPVMTNVKVTYKKS